MLLFIVMVEFVVHVTINKEFYLEVIWGLREKEA